MVVSLLQICETDVDWLGNGTLAIVKDWSTISQPGLPLLVLLSSTRAQTLPERLISEIPLGNNNKTGSLKVHQTDLIHCQVAAAAAELFKFLGGLHP